MHHYVGWTYQRHDGTIGSPVVRAADYTPSLLPDCLLTKHTFGAASAADALAQIGQVRRAITPGIGRHNCTGVTNV